MINKNNQIFKISKVLLLIIIVIISIIIILIIWIKIQETFNIERVKSNTIGTYLLDFTKTTLPSDVKFTVSDSLVFHNLQLTLYPDNTFRISRNIPFFNDSIGIWKIIWDPPYTHIDYLSFNNKFLFQGSTYWIEKDRIDITYIGIGSELIFKKIKYN